MKKVIIGESQALYRAGIVRVLSTDDDLRVVAQCQDWNRLLPAVQTFQHAIVVVGATLNPDFELLAEKVRTADSRLLVIAEDSDSFLRYRLLGASGVVFRSTTAAAFVECVERVHRGEQFVPPGLSTPEEDIVGTRACAQLTPKELKIVALVAEGMKNKQIADSLHTTEQVIKNKLRSVYDKTGVSDRLELALFTIHHRVLAMAAVDASANLEYPGSSKVLPMAPISNERLAPHFRTPRLAAATEAFA